MLPSPDGTRQKEFANRLCPPVTLNAKTRLGKKKVGSLVLRLISHVQTMLLLPLVRSKGHVGLKCIGALSWIVLVAREWVVLIATDKPRMKRIWGRIILIPSESDSR